MSNILITGSGSGLGAKLATTYASDGHHLVLMGRSKEKLETVKNEIEQHQGSAEVITCDLTKPDQVRDAVQQLLQQTTIDVVINNAGVGHFGPLHELTIEEMDTVIDTNVKGTIYLTKYLLPHLLERPTSRIMNIVSTAGLRGKVNESVYVASKFAQRGFTESLVKELENTNITVTAVYVGGMDTPFWDQTDHVEGKKHKFRSPEQVASIIKSQDDGRPEIFVDQ